MTKWRSIKTAPKDGTEILCYYRLGDYAILAFYPDWRGKGKGSWVDDNDVVFMRPDFWMHLPKPPTNQD